MKLRSKVDLKMLLVSFNMSPDCTARARRYNGIGRLVVLHLLFAAAAHSAWAQTTGCPGIGFRYAPTITVGFSPTSITIGDFNKDGKPDLAIGESGETGDTRGVLQLLLGNGDGTFQPSIVFSN